MTHNHHPRTIADLFPGLAVLRRYDRSWLRPDLVAGVSVAAVAVPVAIAYSQLAGVPPVYGLYASILPLVAYAIFGTSRQLILAPDAATCAIVAAIVLPMAGGDADRAVALAMTLSLVTGIFCIAAGFAGLGLLTNFLARPILLGYLNGIALAIVVGQLGKLFGVELPPGGLFRQLAAVTRQLGATHLPTLVTGAVTIALLLALKRTVPRVPGPLVAVAVGILVSLGLDLRAQGVALLGTIPAGLPRPGVPGISLADLERLAYGAVGLALISFNSAMVTARGFAAKNGYEIDPNREFIALGVGDLGAGFLRGFPISGADSRTAVNDAVGGKSQITGLVAATGIVATLLFLTGPLAALPIAVLSAVLVMSAIGLLDLAGLRRLRRVSHQEFRLALVALLGVVTVGVLPGVVVAVGLALVQLLARASRPHDAVLGQLPGGGFADVRSHPAAETFPGVVIFRFDGALVFFNADHFKARVRQVVAEGGPSVRRLVLAAGAIPAADSTGAAALGEICEELRSRGVAVAVAEARKLLREMLERTGLVDRLGAESFFPTLESAVTRRATEVAE